MPVRGPRLRTMILLVDLVVPKHRVFDSYETVVYM